MQSAGVIALKISIFLPQSHSICTFGGMHYEAHVLLQRERGAHTLREEGDVVVIEPEKVIDALHKVLGGD